MEQGPIKPGPPEDPGRYSPATKQDLREMEDRLTEKMRDMQTEVLRAFHNWASPLEIRVRHIGEIETRLGWLEDRISALERGEGPPKPPHQ